VAHVPGASVEACTGLVVDAARQVGADFIVKGLRTPADFEVELQMSLTNHSVSGVRTVFVPTAPAWSFVSSRFIREIALYGGEIGHLVPAPVAARLTEKFASRSDSA
jgi:pantetheine-phosphate adenylyltransferase